MDPVPSGSIFLCCYQHPCDVDILLFLQMATALCTECTDASLYKGQ